MTISDALELALQHHQAGRLADAEVLYRQILAVQPEHPDALHLLGLIAYQRAQHPQAVELISRAIAVNPEFVNYHNNLGLALTALGRLDEAVAACREALRLQPACAEVHNNLGNALRGQGQLEPALEAYRTALQLKPDYAVAQNNLGATLAALGNAGAAIAALRVALQLRPDFVEAHHNLGNAFRDKGELEAALSAYRTALHFKPDFAEAHCTAGIVLNELGQSEAALVALRTAIQYKPDLAEAHCNLGNALQSTGQIEPAIAAYRTALQFKPDDAATYNNLGLALASLGRQAQAIEAYQAALKVQPNLAAIHNNLGNALKDQGQPEAALAAYRQAVSLQPTDALLHSSLIYGLHFLPVYDARLIGDEQLLWNRRHVDPLRASQQAHRNDPDPSRRLKVGFVSPDFYSHAESFFVVPFFKAHDRRLLEICCYSSVRCPDAITDRLRRSVDLWQDVRGMKDAELAEQMRCDGIDILVDLTMHTASNRLLVFARKPAPVQVSWLAYAGSTGLETMDYRLTDTWIDPVGLQDQARSGEQPARLPDAWCCYEPLLDFPNTGELPALREGMVTFGSLNQFGKINEAILRVWTRVLDAVAGSRLLLYCPEGQTQDRVRKLLAMQGVAAERVEFVARGAWADYIGHFGRIDIALDPYPCNGMTTTCHALWMGVPVVSLAGEIAVSRTGLSLLTTVGLPELVADSEEEYVHIAAKLAEDLPRLSALRSTLRARMKQSPLMDAPRFARNVEAAFRTMWRRWCMDKNSSLPSSPEPPALP